MYVMTEEVAQLGFSFALVTNVWHLDCNVSPAKSRNLKNASSRLSYRSLVIGFERESRNTVKGSSYTSMHFLTEKSYLRTNKGAGPMVFGLTVSPSTDDFVKTI